MFITEPKTSKHLAYRENLIWKMNSMQISTNAFEHQLSTRVEDVLSVRLSLWRNQSHTLPPKR